jgi:hypothetical protein
MTTRQQWRQKQRATMTSDEDGKHVVKKTKRDRSKEMTREKKRIKAKKLNCREKQEHGKTQIIRPCMTL